VHVREGPPGSRKRALFRRSAPGSIAVSEHTAPAATVSEHAAGPNAAAGAGPNAAVSGEHAATAAARTAAGGSSARLSAAVRC
jgi:hypothetical protein